MVRCLMSYLIKEGVTVGGVFGERRGPTHQGLVQAVAVVRHAHATLVQVCLLLQKGTWEQREKRVGVLLTIIYISF